MLFWEELSLPDFPDLSGSSDLPGLLESTLLERSDLSCFFDFEDFFDLCFRDLLDLWDLDFLDLDRWLLPRDLLRRELSEDDDEAEESDEDEDDVELADDDDDDEDELECRRLLF